MAKNMNKKKGPVQHVVLSDRGVHLEQASQRQHQGSLGFGQPIIVGTNTDGENIIVNQGQKCPRCNKRVRGPNHAEGDHHKGISPQ